jgi:ParB/RepB/Spo0J family partition protein
MTTKSNSDSTGTTLINAPLAGLNAEPSVLRRIPKAKLVSWPDQPREVFEVAGMQALKGSIERRGQLHPLIVRPITETKGSELFQVIDGERRFRAGVDAGLQEFECIVKTLDDRTAFEVALEACTTSAPFTFMDSIRQVAFLASEKGGKLSSLAIAEKLRLSERMIALYQSVQVKITSEARAEVIRMLEGRAAPSPTTTPNGRVGQNGDGKTSNLQSFADSTKNDAKAASTPDWQLTLQEVAWVSAITGAEKQVAALRLIERLQLQMTAAQKAIDWVGAGNDPAKFDPKGGEKQKRTAWDPSVPDGGLSAKLPPTVSARPSGSDKANISFKVDRHFAPVVAIAAMDAMNQVLTKTGHGEASSPFHAALPQAIEDAALAHDIKSKEDTRKASTPRKADIRSLKRLQDTKAEKEKTEKELMAALETLLGKESVVMSDAQETMKAGDYKGLAKQLGASGKGKSEKSAARFKAAADLARKLASLSKEIEKLSKKVGEATPPAPPTPEQQAQQMKNLAEETGKKLTVQLHQNPEEFAKMTAGMAKGLEQMKDFFTKNPMPTPPPVQTPPAVKPGAPAKAEPANG